MNPRWSATWRRVRRQVLARDGYRCQIGAAGCEIVATHVDHVLPRRFGGTDDPANLRAACSSCNTRRGDGTGHRRHGPPVGSPW